MTNYVYYRLYDGAIIVGWKRVSQHGVQYIRGFGPRWTDREIPHTRAVLLVEIPPAFRYGRICR